jgi:hypothetical protein
MTLERLLTLLNKLDPTLTVCVASEDGALALELSEDDVLYSDTSVLFARGLGNLVPNSMRGE